MNSQQQHANPCLTRNGNDSINQQQQQQLLPPAPRGSTVREQDQYMPIANVIRIMRRILPAHAKISDDAKETVQECVSEYISFITGEANDRCQREQRKTITAEDILWAMGKLGFDDYVEPLTIFINRHRENEGDRTSIRDPILKRGGSAGGAIDYGTRGVAGYGPMYHHHPPPPPPTAADHAAFYGGASGFYRDEGSTWGVVLFAESAGQLFLKAKDNGLCFFQWDCK